MAVGFSGSGGGITYPIRKLEDYWSFLKYAGKKFDLKYVDYFINNTCNLRCKHCYVAYRNENNDLSIKEWEIIFDYCINLGANVFGNVGKEPLLTWDKTKSVLSYFKKKKEEYDKIKFGLVTNGVLLDAKKVAELKDLNPDYIDISIDGNKNIHDVIRGDGNYQKTINGILLLKEAGLQDKVFISYTLNRLNQHSFSSIVHELYQFEITNFLISMCLSNLSFNEQELTTHEYVNFIRDLLSEKSINLSIYKNTSLHIRNDFTSLKYQNELIKQKIINTDKLLIDDNDGLYYIYNVGANKVIFNIQTWNPDFWYALRVSHDGYVSNCYDMFFDNYPERAIGNVREKSIREILENRSVFKEEYASSNFL